MSRWRASHYTCSTAEAAFEENAAPEEECNGSVSRQHVRWYGGAPYCHPCILRLLREQRERQRFAALRLA